MPTREGVITLRPIAPEDADFLRAVYASTREQELDATDWDAAQRDEFLTSQFALQHHHYTTHFFDAQFSIIECAGEPLGRIYVHRGPIEINVMEIALLPAHRNRGIGAELLNRVLEEAEKMRRPVTAYVDANNSGSHRFFARHGFVATGWEGAHCKMTWTPG